jgi:hypothetical protein
MHLPQPNPKQRAVYPDTVKKRPLSPRQEVAQPAQCKHRRKRCATGALKGQRRGLLHRPYRRKGELLRELDRFTFREFQVQASSASRRSLRSAWSFPAV